MLLKSYKTQQFHSLQKISTTVFAVIVLMLTSLSASASGSGSGGGAWPTGNFHHGKQVFAQKLYCETCPLAGKILTKNYISEIMPEISRNGSLGQNLSIRERKSVKQFLKSKFNL